MTVLTSTLKQRRKMKKLKGFLKDFCLSDEGWRKVGSRKTYRISELDPVEDYLTTFYKDRRLLFIHF